jgi:hypothetical protein
MQCVVVLNVVMQSVFKMTASFPEFIVLSSLIAEYHYTWCCFPATINLNVIVLSVIMQSVIFLSVVAPTQKLSNSSKTLSLFKT